MWPLADLGDFDGDVRYWGVEQTCPWPTATSAFDPTETCAPQDCCDAERVDIKKDYGGKIVRNANGATPIVSIRYLIA